MSFLLSHWRTLCRVFGVGFLGVGLAMALAWFFWLVPTIIRFDPEWSTRFSRRHYWTRTEHYIRRYRWMHGDAEDVGKYGDRGWAEWILSKAAQGVEIADCSGGCAHGTSALEYMTGQDPTHQKENGQERGMAGKAWLDWWKDNRDKTQEQWIRDGLARHGVVVHLPPTPADQLPLLTLLGSTSTNRLERVPRYVTYNAFRWLRDSGFDPLAFALTNVNSDTPETVKQGLFAYAKQVDRYPKSDEVGILAFGRNTPPVSFPGPYLLSRSVKVTAYVVMGMLIVLGAVLLFLSRYPEGKSGGDTQAGSPK